MKENTQKSPHEPEIKLNDFRDITIKIPGHINADICEDRNGFLFDANVGRVYALNRTASFIYAKIQQGMSLSKIVHALVDHFDVHEPMAISDIQDFLYQLRELNIGLTDD